jgi:hypothetical protein
MRPVRVEARHPDSALLTDDDRRYCVFNRGAGTYVVYRLDRRGFPSLALGDAQTMRDARMIIRRHRGPFGRRDWAWIITCGVLLAGAIGLVAATSFTLWHLVIAMAILAGILTLLAFALLAFAICAFARCLNGMGIF